MLARVVYTAIEHLIESDFISQLKNIFTYQRWCPFQSSAYFLQRWLTKLLFLNLCEQTRKALALLRPLLEKSNVSPISRGNEIYLNNATKT